MSDRKETPSPLQVAKEAAVEAQPRKSYMVSIDGSEEDDLLLQEILAFFDARIVTTRKRNNRAPIHTVEMHESQVDRIRQEVPSVVIEPNSSLMFPGNE